MAVWYQEGDEDIAVYHDTAPRCEAQSETNAKILSGNSRVGPASLCSMSLAGKNARDHCIGPKCEDQTEVLCLRLVVQDTAVSGHSRGRRVRRVCQQESPD